MWGNKAVINWMTPFQCPLINSAQKPHGFLGGSSQMKPVFSILTYSRGARSSENNSPSKASFSILIHVDSWFCLCTRCEIHFLSLRFDSALCGSLRKHVRHFIYLDSNHGPEQTSLLPPLGLKKRRSKRHKIQWSPSRNVQSISPDAGRAPRRWTRWCTETSFFIIFCRSSVFILQEASGSRL